MIEDKELLTRFAHAEDQHAFRLWVEHRLPLVYSTALRMLNGDRQLAEDIAQKVFADAARRATELASHPALSGWLHTSTRFAATKLIRSQSRRQQREKTATMDPALKPTPINWESVRPVIDEALAELPESDRDAVIQRFFNHADYPTLARHLDLTPNAARMRVDRALEKLSSNLDRRGIRSTGAALGATLGSNAIIAAPTGLASSIASGALNAFSSGGTLAILLGYISAQKAPLTLSIAILAVGSFSLTVKAKRDLEPGPSAGVTEPSEVEEITVEKPPTETLFRQVSTAEKLARDATAMREELRRLDAAIAAKSKYPSPTAHIYDITELDKTPAVRNQTKPHFPTELKDKGISGRALISFTVDASGRVHDLQTVEATHPEFAESSLAAISEWRFSPGEIDGTPVNTRIEIPMMFTINQNKFAADVWF